MTSSPNFLYGAYQLKSIILYVPTKYLVLNVAVILGASFTPVNVWYISKTAFFTSSTKLNNPNKFEKALPTLDGAFLISDVSLSSSLVDQSELLILLVISPILPELPPRSPSTWLSESGLSAPWLFEKPL